jgi:hypothetical protein
LPSRSSVHEPHAHLTSGMRVPVCAAHTGMPWEFFESAIFEQKGHVCVFERPYTFLRITCSA